MDKTGNTKESHMGRKELSGYGIDLEEDMYEDISRSKYWR